MTESADEHMGERDRAMSGGRMVAMLGFFSSHPRHAVGRVILWYVIAAVPFAVGAIVLATILSRPHDDLVAFLGLYGREIVLYGLAALGFAAGLGLTAGIAARAARSSLLVADSGNPPVGFGFAILLLIALGTLPWLLPVVLDLEPRTRALLAVLGVLPLVIVVAIASMAPADDPNGNPVSRPIRWWTLAFPAAAIAIIALTRVGGIADRMAQWDWVDRVVRVSATAKPSWTGEFVIDGDEAGSIRSWIVTGIITIAMVPVLCLAVMLVALLRDAITGSSSERRRRVRPSAKERAARRGLLGEGRTAAGPRSRRVGLSVGQPQAGSLQVLASDGTRTDADAEPPAETPAEAPPAWIDALRDSVDPERSFGDWAATRFAPGETAPAYAGSDSFREFFSGRTPSADQVEAFVRVHDRFLASVDGGASRPAWGIPSSDAIIEGPPGSGRTAVIAAAAVHSAVSRGVAVLVLVPNDCKRRALIRRIRRVAESAGVGWYLNVGDLTSAGRAPWVQPDDGRGSSGAQATEEPPQASARVESAGERIGRQDRERRRAELERSSVAPGSTPDILVGTLPEFEECFFAGSADFLRLRAVLVRIGLVVAEDVELFDVRHRIHLPAVLDKLRLFLGSEGLRPQTVVVAPRLVEVARSFLAERLLSGRDRIEPCRLRPFRLPDDVGEPWQVTLRAAEPGPGGVSDLIKRCAKSVTSSGSDVIVYSPFMSASERRELAASIETAGSGSVTVVSDLDELDDQDSADLGAVFHAATDCASASLAIRAAAGRSDPVVFTVVPSGIGDLDRGPSSELLVLPDGASRSLFAAHFRSVSRFIGRLKAVHRDFWSRLGLPPSGDLAVVDGADGALPVAVRNDDRSVILDPPDLQIIRSGREIAWPWAAVSNRGAGAKGKFEQPSAAPVDIEGMLDASLSIEVSRGADEFTVIARDAGPDALAGVGERRVAEWVSGADGQSIAFDDLAYASRLSLDRGDTNFIPLSISERDGTGRGKIRIDGQLWSELRSQSGQSSLLVMQLRDFNVPPLCAPRRSLQSALPRHVRLVETELDPVRLTAMRVERQTEGRQIDPLELRQYATLDIEGVTNDRGEVVRQPFAIRYEASSFFMLFGFPEPELEDGRLRAALFGRWGEGMPAARSPEPELGLAASFALRRHAPGLERLARCIGFRVGGLDGCERPGILFLEPASTRRSAFRLVDWMVRDETLLAEALGSMESALEEHSRDPSGGVGRLLSRGRSVIGADVSADSLVQLHQERSARVAAELREALAARPAGRGSR